MNILQAIQQIAAEGPQPCFRVVLRPAGHVDGQRALRRALKSLSRTYGLTAVHVEKLDEWPSTEGAAS
jgi:hypothetical protein